ncbi:4,5-DOPA dioxygenase extradiol [Flavobacterium bizetiae]|uniref:4,5-DOPA dioxygenase extradiol n=2 Tax=Flavobacterium bizetiae TaxID=2704140 RepID=A0A6J4GUX3_9FLAO|nr:4,5-DOPA dioxygenase extradiol [Flavobacterium bizetiae]CAD5341624.1 4,5-DOPA dioxygenase extradiol [Flavobacterium bizetiae]CAD5348210.1 4,5-DOPA dioxygenase extradiol [Flavobacterium bizetiae]
MAKENIFTMTTLNDLHSISSTFSNTDKMPVLFLGHGSPMNAIEENQFVAGFRNLAKTLPQPNAILCISAHWFTNGTKVTSMQMPRTIHDFGGFPQALFDVQYPAKGSPELALETKRILDPVHVDLDEHWGLDHGAWSVIKHLYPEANVPVIQLSIDYTKSGQYHFELAQKLQSLRHKGVLIIGSGNIVHNLRLVDFRNFDKDNYGYDWAIEARETINNYLLDENFQPLIDFEKMNKAIQLAIPTPDHYLPLLYTLGLKEKSEELSLFNDKLLAGSLSMTSVKIM